MISIRLYSSLSELLQMLAIPRQQKRHENTRPLTTPLNFAVWVKIGALCAFLIIDLTFSQIKREKKVEHLKKSLLPDSQQWNVKEIQIFLITFRSISPYIIDVIYLSSRLLIAALLYHWLSCISISMLCFFLSLILLYVHARAVPGGLVRYVCFFLCSAWPHFHMIASDTCLQDKFLCSAYRCCADNQRHSENMRQMETICTMNNF